MKTRHSLKINIKIVCSCYNLWKYTQIKQLVFDCQTVTICFVKPYLFRAPNLQTLIACLSISTSDFVSSPFPFLFLIAIVNNTFF